MRKIFTLFILLLLLPVTALAAEGAPGSLYVAGQQITDEGYYTQSGGNWTKSGDASTPPSAPYFHYTKGNDNTPATLTLSGATIQGGTSTGSVPYGAGIYAQCNSRESVSLTIELIGENTITGYYGIYVNAEISADSYGTDASLTITGESNGSLKVSGSYHGIYVKSGTGGASLNINDASVVASSSSSHFSYAGVYVQSSAHATSSPQLSLKVNGGSLTTSASEGNDGIQFYVGSSQASKATTSLTVSDNAIVRANGGIKASDSSMSDLSDQIKVSSGDGTNGGIVFDGTEGTVYGKVELQEDLKIGEGESLTIPQGASLNTGSHEVIVNGGTLNGADKITGTVKYAPTITTQPASQTVTEGNTATFTVAATGEKLSYQWQQSTDNGQSWTDISGANAATYTTAATTTSMSGYQYRCVVSNSAGSVTSNAATLTVNAATVPVTGVTLEPTSLSLFTGDTAPLTATVQPSDATNQNVTWQSDNANVATVQNGTVNAVGAGEATITATAGGITATCVVHVRKPATVEASGSTNLSFTTDRNEFTLTAIVYGENLSQEPNCWEWTVANTDVVSLSDTPNLRSGSVASSRKAFTIKGTGTTTITATYDDGTYRGSVDFTVQISKPTPPDPISYYNIYVEDVCDGVEVSTSKQVVREGGSINVYVEKDTANYTFDNFHVYYKEGYYDSWDELKEGTQPGEYPIKNIWTHIYIKAEGAEEKEDPTGIESIEGVKVYTKDGSLYVQTPQREQVIIVSMSGAVVKNEEQIGLKQYHGLQPGIYIVRVGDRAYKLRLH